MLKYLWWRVLVALAIAAGVAAVLGALLAAIGFSGWSTLAGVIFGSGAFTLIQSAVRLALSRKAFEDRRLADIAWLEARNARVRRENPDYAKWLREQGLE